MPSYFVNLTIASDSGNTFSNSRQNDVLLYAEDSNQAILIGQDTNAHAALTLTPSNITVATHVVPNANEAYDLGASNLRFRDLYLSGSTIDLGGIKLGLDSNNDLEVRDSNAQLKRLVVDQVVLGDPSSDPIILKKSAQGALDISTSAGGVLGLDASQIVTGTMSNERLTAASTSVAGIVQLLDSTSSTSTSNAATPSAVKNAYDLANTASNIASLRVLKTGDTMTGTLVVPTISASNVNASNLSGNGSGLTSLNASSIASGTVPTPRLPAASTSASGVVQLLDSTSSTSTSNAATPSAVKNAYDLATTASNAAGARVLRTGDTMTGTLNVPTLNSTGVVKCGYMSVQGDGAGLEGGEMRLLNPGQVHDGTGWVMDNYNSNLRCWYTSSNTAMTLYQNGNATFNGSMIVKKKVGINMGSDPETELEVLGHAKINRVVNTIRTIAFHGYNIDGNGMGGGNLHYNNVDGLALFNKYYNVNNNKYFYFFYINVYYRLQFNGGINPVIAGIYNVQRSLDRGVTWNTPPIGTFPISINDDPATAQIGVIEVEEPPESTFINNKFISPVMKVEGNDITFTGNISAGNMGVGTIAPRTKLDVISGTDIAINPLSYNSLLVFDDQKSTTTFNGTLLEYANRNTASNYIELNPVQQASGGTVAWNCHPGNSWSLSFDHFCGGGNGGDGVRVYMYGQKLNIYFDEFNNRISTAWNDAIIDDWSLTSAENAYFYNWKKVDITYVRGTINYTLGGNLRRTVVDRERPEIYSETASGMSFYGWSGANTNAHRIRNVKLSKLTEGPWTFASPTSSDLVYNLGNIGVGTSTPTQRLDVNGNIQCNSISAGNLGMFRNRVINGDMRIDRIAGAFAFGSGYVTDMYVLNTTTTGGTGTIQIIPISGSSDTPTYHGLTQVMRIAVGATGYTLGNNDYIILKCRIEASNISDFNWVGNGIGSPITVSFWFRGNILGKYSFVLRNTLGQVQTYVESFTNTTIDVWTRYTFTVPPPMGTGALWTAGDNRVGLDIQIGGIDKAATATTPGWSTPGNDVNSLVGMVDWSAFQWGYFDITGIQLEKGTIATPFEFRPLAIERQLCQRYFYRITSPSLATFITSGTVVNNLGVVYAIIPFPTPMRVQPYVYINGSLFCRAGAAVTSSSSIGNVPGGTSTGQVNMGAFTVNLSITPAAGTGVVFALEEGSSLTFMAEL